MFGAKKHTLLWNLGPRANTKQRSVCAERKLVSERSSKMKLGLGNRVTSEFSHEYFSVEGRGKQGVVAHVCNPSSREAEARGSLQEQGQLNYT